MLGVGVLMAGLAELVQLVPPRGEGLAAPVAAGAAAIITACICAALSRRGQSEQLAALRHAAITDPLTGLLNRRGLQDRIELELARAERGAGPLVLMVIDLDHFKQVNDRLGHLGGDMALERAAGVLQRELRVVDAAARIGGEEFAVLLPDTGVFEGLAAGERLRVRIERSFEGTAVALTASVGLAASPQDGRTMEELLHAADRAMYTAKALGRNRCVIFDAENARGTEQVALAS